MAFTPQIDNGMTIQSQTIELPSKTYKLNINNENQIENTRIIGYVDNLEAIRQAVYHILSVERYAYLIYDENYGVELEKYIGKDLDYIETTIEDTLKEALTYDLRIVNVEVTNIIQISTDVVNIQFTVYSIYGNLQLEVNVNV